MTAIRYAVLNDRVRNWVGSGAIVFSSRIWVGGLLAFLVDQGRFHRKEAAIQVRFARYELLRNGAQKLCDSQLGDRKVRLWLSTPVVLPESLYWIIQYDGQTLEYSCLLLQFEP